MTRIGLSLAFIAVIATSSPAAAQATADPLNFDILGIKLYMSPDEVLAAIHNSLPNAHKLVTMKRYNNAHDAAGHPNYIKSISGNYDDNHGIDVRFGYDYTTAKTLATSVRLTIFQNGPAITLDYPTVERRALEKYGPPSADDLASHLWCANPTKVPASNSPYGNMPEHMACNEAGPLLSMSSGGGQIGLSLSDSDRAKQLQGQEAALQPKISPNF
jgi:hypothetical protein